MPIRSFLALAAVAVSACSAGNAGAPGGQALVPARVDLGPSAPEATGKPIRFAFDGVELGMSFDEVRARWGKPASSTGEFHMQYANKGGYARVDLHSAASVLMRMELRPKPDAEPLQAEALARLSQQFGVPITDARELELEGIGGSGDKTLFRPARYAYAVASWLPDPKDETIRRLWTVEVSLHPGRLLQVPATEWASLHYPIPWSPPAGFKERLEMLELSKAKTSDVEALLGPPTRTFRREPYAVWEYWFWEKEGRAAQFSFENEVLYGRGF